MGTGTNRYRYHLWLALSKRGQDDPAQVEAIRRATLIRARVVSPAATVKLQESLRRLGADEGIVASVAPAAPRTPSNLAPRSGEDGRVEPKER